MANQVEHRHRNVRPLFRTIRLLKSWKSKVTILGFPRGEYDLTVYCRKT